MNIYIYREREREGGIEEESESFLKERMREAERGKLDKNKEG